MGQLQFVTMASRALMGSAQADLASRSIVAFKVRLKGDVFFNLPDGDAATLVCIADNAGANVTVAIKVTRSDPNFVFSFDHNTAAEGIQATIATSAFSADNYYVVYGHLSTASPYMYIECFESDGTSRGNASFTGFDPGSTSAVNYLMLSSPDAFYQAQGIMDGAAAYGAVLAGAARYSVPTTGDSDLLWLSFLADASGATVTAATGNNLTLNGTETTDYAWIAGGTWDAAAGGAAGGGAYYQHYYLSVVT